MVDYSVWSTPPTHSHRPRVKGSGQIKTRFLSRVSHGLSGLGNFFDIIFVRLLWFASLFTAAATFLLMTLIVLRLVDWVQSGFEEFVPGWGTFVAGFIVFATLQVWLFAATGTLLAMINRQSMKPVPLHETENLSRKANVLHPKSPRLSR